MILNLSFPVIPTSLPMVAITEFPPELLMLVSEHLSINRTARTVSTDWEAHEAVRSGVSRTADLAALSLVSKQMRAIAAPILFEPIQPPPSFIFRDSTSVEDLRKTFASMQCLADYAKKIHLGFSFESADEIVISNAMVLLTEALRACLQLTTLLGIPMACLEHPTFIQAVNEHCSVSAVYMELLPYVVNSPRSLTGVIPATGLLRKFKCTIAAAPMFPLTPSLQVILEQSMQIERVRLRYLLSGDMQWMFSPYFAGVQELLFSHFGDNENMAAKIVSALRVHPNITRIQLSYMPLAMLYRLCGQKVPSIWISSTGRPSSPSVAQAACYVDRSESRVVRCRTLKVTQFPSTFECTTAIPAILDSLSAPFPSLEDLDITFPRKMSFLEGLREQDANMIIAFQRFRELRSLTLRLDDSQLSGEGWSRVGDIVVSLADSMPLLRTISINPQNLSRKTGRGLEFGLAGSRIDADERKRLLQIFSGSSLSKNGIS